MRMNNIEVIQNVYKAASGQVMNEFHFITETGVHLGGLIFPPNGQYLFDAKALNLISRALAIRWNIIPMPKKF